MSATDQSVSSAMVRLTFLALPLLIGGHICHGHGGQCWGGPGGGVQRAPQLSPTVLLTAAAPGFAAGCSLWAGRPTSLVLRAPPSSSRAFGGVLGQKGGERQTLTRLENRTQSSSFLL